MLKAILGIIVSYVVMAILVTILLVGGVLLLGLDNFFKTDSYEVSGLWTVISLVISFGSGILGGYICVVISGSVKACKVLAVIVIIAAVVMCLPRIQDDPHIRAGEITTKEAVQLAQMPRWLYAVSPFLAAVGILTGAGRGLRRQETAR